MKETDVDLSTYLLQLDYLQFPLTLNSIGYFQLDVMISGEVLNFILDTGASKTVIHQGTAERLEVKLMDTFGTGGGVGTSEAKIYIADIQDFTIKDYAVKDLSIYSMDLGHVNEALSQREESAVDGVIGFDLLDRQDAVIDFKSRTLFLKQ